MSGHRPWSQLRDELAQRRRHERAGWGEAALAWTLLVLANISYTLDNIDGRDWFGLAVACVGVVCTVALAVCAWKQWRR